MASFFGDLKFYSSRAFLDEEDAEDLEEDVKLPVVKLSLISEEEFSRKKEDIKIVYVSYGKLPNEFSEEALLCGMDFKKIGSISSYESDSDASSTPLCTLHCSKDSLLILCQEYKNQSHLANYIAKEIFKLIPCNCPVRVYTAAHISKLRTAVGDSSEDNRFCVTKCLASPAHKDESPCPRIPQPATFEDVPASIMTEALFTGSDCLLYVSYLEPSVHATDSTYGEEMSKLLKLSYKGNTQSVLKLRRQKGAKSTASDLYI